MTGYTVNIPLQGFAESDFSVDCASTDKTFYYKNFIILQKEKIRCGSMGQTQT